jgi:hypothetical protein
MGPIPSRRRAKPSSGRPDNTEGTACNKRFRDRNCFGKGALTMLLILFLVGYALIFRPPIQISIGADPASAAAGAALGSAVGAYTARRRRR